MTFLDLVNKFKKQGKSNREATALALLEAKALKEEAEKKAHKVEKKRKAKEDAQRKREKKAAQKCASLRGEGGLLAELTAVEL